LKHRAHFALAVILAIAVPGFAQGRREQSRPQRDQQVQSQQGKGSTPSRNSNDQGGKSDQQPSAQSRGSGSRFGGPGPHVGDWLRRFGKVPAQEQKKQLENDPQFQQLPRESQDQLRDRLDKFNNLPEERRNRILKRMEVFEHMSPEQQKEAREIFGRIRELPADRRQAVRRSARTLRGMPPAARERYLNSDEIQNNFSEQERDILRGLSKIEPPEVDPKDEQ
jgi:hypothetical protein